MTRPACVPVLLRALAAVLALLGVLLLAVAVHTMLTPEPSRSPSVVLGTPASPAQPRSTPSRADRTRPTAGHTHAHVHPKRTLVKRDGLNWAALARCESSGNPRAVSSSGKYRGLYQADASFWRTYGGLAYASRADLATASQQTAVAMRGYQARGRSPWPSCGWRL